MKEQIDRLTEKYADHLQQEAGPDTVVIVLVADKTDAHIAQRGEAFRKLGVLQILLKIIEQDGLKSVHWGSSE